MRSRKPVSRPQILLRFKPVRHRFRPFRTRFERFRQNHPPSRGLLRHPEPGLNRKIGQILLSASDLRQNGFVSQKNIFAHPHIRTASDACAFPRNTSLTKYYTTAPRGCQARQRFLLGFLGDSSPEVHPICRCGIAWGDSSVPTRGNEAVAHVPDGAGAV